jgi:tetratricopeptide (TPR) repeat protein
LIEMRWTALALAAGLCAVWGGAAYAAKAPAKPAAAKTYDEAALKGLEAKLAKNPKDAKLKSEVAEANYQVGYYIEYKKPGLTPREKYRPALKHYRRALELNPSHASAAREKKQIEDIYTQMGMPIPK